MWRPNRNLTFRYQLRDVWGFYCVVDDDDDVVGSGRNPEYGGSMFLRNTATFRRVYAVPKPTTSTGFNCSGNGLWHEVSIISRELTSTGSRLPTKRVTTNVCPVWQPLESIPVSEQSPNSLGTEFLPTRSIHCVWATAYIASCNKNQSNLISTYPSSVRPLNVGHSSFHPIKCNFS
jgi:hypothetical protein